MAGSAEPKHASGIVPPQWTPELMVFAWEALPEEAKQALEEHGFLANGGKQAPLESYYGAMPYLWAFLHGCAASASRAGQRIPDAVWPRPLWAWFGAVNAAGRRTLN